MVAVTALAALLGGCSRSAPASTGTATSPSASAAQQAPTPSATSPGSKPAADLRELAQRMNAAARAKRTARVRFTTGSASTMNGAIRYHGNGADIAVTADTTGRHVKIVVVDGVGYVAPGQKILGKTWAKISSTGKDALSRALRPVLTNLSTSLDVSSQLAKAPDAKIESSSPAELDGVGVTRYVVIISEKDLVRQLSNLPLSPAQRQQIAAQFKGAHGRSVLYVDDADLLRRVESTIVGGKAPPSPGVVTYSHWGEPVEITAPPTSDTVDASALG